MKDNKHNNRGKLKTWADKQCLSKMPFNSQNAAITSAFNSLKGKNSSPFGFRAYECRICKKWHLTKKLEE